MTFDKILNWRLLSGSHHSPGPDGGTCINEAALVAAGFEYLAISCVRDMPPCFSQVIAQYAMTLNDGMPDDQRQRLLPYVGRLAGTVDAPDVEYRRAAFLAIEACRRFVSRALDAAGLPAEAARCRAVETLDQAAVVTKAAQQAARNMTMTPGQAAAVKEAALAGAAAAGAAAEAAAGAARMAARAAAVAAEAAAVAAAERAAAARMATAEEAAGAARMAARAAAGAARAAEAAVAVETAQGAQAWDEALEVFDGVLAIGRQAEPLDVALVAERLERAKTINER